MEATASFRNRSEAGSQLASRLRSYADTDAVVLALPRGGIPVGHAISVALRLPLDIIVVRKLGVPGHEEYAMGAIARGVRVLRQEVLHKLQIPASAVEEVARREQQEIARREQRYRGGDAPAGLAGKTAILVDDGLATGSTMEAAIQAVSAQEPGEIVVAVPVGAADSCEKLAGMANEVVCLRTPSPFHAVSWWYDEFEQVDDEEACRLLREAKSRSAAPR